MSTAFLVIFIRHGSTVDSAPGGVDRLQGVELKLQTSYANTGDLQLASVCRTEGGPFESGRELVDFTSAARLDLRNEYQWRIVSRCWRDLRFDQAFKHVFEPIEHSDGDPLAHRLKDLNGEPGDDLLVGPDKIHELEDAFRVHLRQNPAVAARIVEQNPEGPLAVSHRTGKRKNSAGNPQRYDAIWVSPEFDVGNVDYLYEKSVEAGSDHALVAADVSLK